MNMKKALGMITAFTLTVSSASFSGKISAETAKADIDPVIYENLIRFDQRDTDKDGILSEEEFAAIKNKCFILNSVNEQSENQ